MKWKKAIMLALLSINTAYASTNGIVGVWVTSDDKTGEELSEVKIWREGDTLQGKIIKLMNPPENPICDKCKGELKNTNVVGLTILSEIKFEQETWSSGYILDPENGKTYRATLDLLEGGNKLKVRGYIGIPALGRTQYWRRSGLNRD